MATFYLDFEGGNDSNDGTTFANRWKTITNGATAARTAPGDTIRIMGSPAPTSLGINGTWTSGALQGTKTLTAATNATPIAITITGHGYSTGDTVVVTGVVGNTAANGTWEITVTDANTFTLDNSAGNGNRTSGGTARLRNNTRVMLASAVTQNIASTGPGRAAWTASANVSTSLITTTSQIKEHATSDSITINTAFTTGKAAYWALPSTLDLSAYQQVSFWYYTNNDAINAGEAELRLCSDATGDTVVNTIPIPANAAQLRWMPVTVDTGSALGNSIASISLYINSDLSTTLNVQILFNNIIACKASSAADSLTLTSLIGKNTTGETWWGIQSINGTRVMLDADTNGTPTSTNVRGYYGTSETVTTWKRETIKLGPAANATTALQTIQESGTDGSPITYSGGWDRTAMSTQNLETWLDGQNGNGDAITGSTRSWITYHKISGSRFSQVWSHLGSTNVGTRWEYIAGTNNTALIINAGIARQGAIILNAAVANILGGLAIPPYFSEVVIDGPICSNNSDGIGPQSAFQCTDNGIVANNNGYAMAITAVFSKPVKLKSANNVSGSINLGNFSGVYLNSSEMSEAATATWSTAGGTDGIIYSQNHDSTTNNHKIFMNGALISSATDQRNTASGISWKIQPTSANRSASWPVVLSLAKVACAANAAVTVKAWMRRSNTGLTMRLVCKGGQIAGVTSDVVSAMTAAADTWAEQTITFTPTETGVVEITAEAWGGTTYSGWVDDMTISQA